MKPLFLTLALLLPISIFSQIAYLQNSLTVYTNGHAPSVSGSVRVLETIYVNLSDSLYGTPKTIARTQVSGDSLIVYPDTGNQLYVCITPLQYQMQMPIQAACGTPTVFNPSGIYRAFIGNLRSRALSPAGRFRILPQMSTIPASPVSSKPLQIDLILGQLYGCDKQYRDSAVVRDSTLLLRYVQLPPVMCIRADTVQYGPKIAAGTLKAGTYQVMIEDSVAIGSITVYQTVTLQGSAVIMQDPRLRIATRPVAGAVIRAYPTPQCPPLWYLNAPIAVPDTLLDTTDATGQFSITVANTGAAYVIEANAAGYHPQKIWLLASALTGGARFELLTNTLTAVTPLTVKVTGGTAPVESASVSLWSGAQLVCPVYGLEKIAAPGDTAVDTKYLSGVTGRNGVLNLADLPLAFYIDYSYTASKVVGGQSKYQTGAVRLNKFWNDTLRIDLNASRTEQNLEPAALGTWLNIAPNPFNPATVITFSNPGRNADLAIYAVTGKQVAAFSNLTADRIVWTPSGLPSGIYIVKARIGGRQLAKRIMLQK